MSCIYLPMRKRAPVRSHTTELAAAELIKETSPFVPISMYAASPALFRFVTRSRWTTPGLRPAGRYNTP